MYYILTIFDNNYNIFSFTITNKRISPFGILSVYLEYEKLPGYENVNLPENKIIFSQMGINMNSCFYFEVPYGAKVTIKGLENTNSPEIIKFTDINKNGTFNIKTRNLGPNIISNTSYMYMNMPDGIKNADATSNEGSPSVSSVTYSSDKDKEFMRNEILNAVTFPNNRGIKIDKSIEGSIPTKPSEEAVEVPILLTYQDGSKRIVKVPVIVTKQTQAQKDTALTATEVRYKTNATEQEIEEKIKEAVSTTTQGIIIENKEIIGKIPDAYTNGQAENVEVKVTYADKSTKTIQVPVVVLQTDAQKYKPTVSGNVSVNKDKVSDQETVKEILGKVEVAKEAGHVDKAIKGTVPNTVGEHNVIVEVTYADGTKAEATVVVNVTEDSREKSFSGGSKRTHNSKKDGKVIKKIDFKNYTNRHFAYMFGYPDGKVRPNREITRAELAAIVVRLEGLDSSDNLKPKFNDTGSNWYNGVINAVVKAKYMVGYPDGRFMPNRPVTRAEVIKIISTIENNHKLDYLRNRKEKIYFKDVYGHWAEREIYKVYSDGIIDGYLDRTFKPDENITRAEAVKVWNRLYNRNLDKDGLNNVINNPLLKMYPDNLETKWYYYDIIEATNSHEYYYLENNEEVWINLIK